MRAANNLAEILRATLRERLRDQGLSGNQLAIRAGMSGQAIYSLLAGGYAGSLDTWSRLLDALDRDAEQPYPDGTISNSVLARPLRPRLVVGEHEADLSYGLHEDGIRHGVRSYVIELPVDRRDALFAGRAHLQFDRILARTAFTFTATPVQPELEFQP